VTVPKIAPMSATTGDLPTDDDKWLFEPKWDGMRAIVQLDHGEVRAWSRTDREVTREFPELAGLAGLSDRAVLDGEIVAMGDDGRTSFGRLQRRFGVTDPTQVAARARSVPAFYVVFDVLHLDGEDRVALPQIERRELLEELVSDGPTWRTTPSGRGHGQAWLDVAREQRLEGIMAKRVDAPYQPGRRSEVWRKVKIRHQQEFLVCGWTPGTGARDRSDAIGSLVLGCHGPDGLRWVGNVGTGFDQAALRWWRAEMDAAAAERPPFDEPVVHPALRQARWVHPEHVVQVAYAEWTTDRRLRQPSLVGRRTDVDASSVRCEE
jgi:bifunctional non-homologous end joining protein LigD